MPFDLFIYIDNVHACLSMNMLNAFYQSLRAVIFLKHESHQGTMGKSCTVDQSPSVPQTRPAKYFESHIILYNTHPGLAPPDRTWSSRWWRGASRRSCLVFGLPHASYSRISSFTTHTLNGINSRASYRDPWICAIVCSHLGSFHTILAERISRQSQHSTRCLATITHPGGPI